MENTMAEKKRGLGRGLSALIGDADIGLAADKATAAGSPGPADGSGTAKGGAGTLGVENLVPGRFQPRREFEPEALQELARSVKEKGILQPILVRPNPDKASDAPYEIVAGERRWRAAQMARLHDVPVIIRELNDGEALQVGIIENVQRADLNPIEEAEAFQRLIDEFGYTQEVLAKTLGKSRSHIANTLRLVGATEKVRDCLVKGLLSAGHARALLGHQDADTLAADAVKRGLSVREVERLAAARGANKKTGGGKKTPGKDPDTLALEKSVADNLGLSVDIRHGEAGGHIRVSYKTLEQLDEIVRRLMTASG